MPDVLTLVGSLRAASYNRALAHAARAAAPPALRLRLAGLGGIPVFSEDLEADGLPGPVRTLADGILAADALVIITPEYNFSIPGGLKNALDWLSRDPRGPLRGFPWRPPAPPWAPAAPARPKPASGTSCTGLGAHCLPLPLLEITQARRKFDQAGQLTDPATRSQLDDYLNQLSKWLSNGNRA